MNWNFCGGIIFWVFSLLHKWLLIDYEISYFFVGCVNVAQNLKLYTVTQTNNNKWGNFYLYMSVALECVPTTRKTHSKLFLLYIYIYICNVLGRYGAFSMNIILVKWFVVLFIYFLSTIMMIIDSLYIKWFISLKDIFW